MKNYRNLFPPVLIILMVLSVYMPVLLQLPFIILLLALSKSSADAKVMISLLSSFVIASTIDLGLFLPFSASLVFDQTKRERRSTAAAISKSLGDTLIPLSDIADLESSRSPAASVAMSLTGSWV